MRYFSRAFWAATGERAVKTFAQTLAALLAATGTGVLDVGWTSALSVAATASVVSLLSSVASGGVGPTGPSLTTEGLKRRVAPTA
ncbi:hypothetical protein GCM10027446_22730 [Angustibacter peucedani]